MKILCVVDILLYRTFLSKFFLSMGLEYRFVEPEHALIGETMSEFSPDAVLLQDSYHNRSQGAVIGQGRGLAARLGISPILLVLRTCPDENAPVHDGDKLIVVNRQNLREVMEGLLERHVPASGGARPAGSGGNRSGNILFVDSGRTLFHVVRSSLAANGYRVRQARDAVEALDLCADQNFELILSSVQLPGMDGLELCRRIKESNVGRYLPVIILSSSDDPLDVDTAFNSGADDYLLKSFTPGCLPTRSPTTWTPCTASGRTRSWWSTTARSSGRCCVTAS
jgi:CheY-like chemotaxis protein